MAFKIYTKTGDLGKTSLIGGTKVPKSDLRIEAYGTVDELNSYIGLVSDSFAASSPALSEIQDRLFTIGSLLACDPSKETGLKIPDLHESDVIFLEEEIDRMELQLVPMRSFILPGGHPTVSFAHIARCVCRRAERLAVNLLEHGAFVEPLVVQYLNRLSDYLFVLSRFIAHTLGVREIAWKARV